ncbi:hypothetical protein PENTCL1PPCAC_13998, partial [Pristionchus entomophagus]
TNAVLQATSEAAMDRVDSDSLFAEIEAQGNIVRDAKIKDAASCATKAAIAKLLELKKEYYDKTGKEYKPRAATDTAAASPEEEIAAQIRAQENLVRRLEEEAARSNEAKVALAKLLQLKKEYKAVTGCEYNASSTVTA